MKVILCLVVLWLCLGAIVPVAAETTETSSDFAIAVVSDGPSQQAREIEAIFKGKIVALTEGEISVEFPSFSGTWSRESIQGALRRAYADPPKPKAAAGNSSNWRNSTSPTPCSG